MSWKVSRSGVFKTIANIKVRRSGAWKTVSRIRIWKTHGNPPTVGWRTCYVKSGDPPPVNPPPTNPPNNPPPVTLSVTVNPTALAVNRKGVDFIFPIVVTTSFAATAAATGGTGPYTYKWTLVSWTGSPAPTIGSPNSATSFFSKSMNDYGYETATFKCTATDSKGNKGSVTVTASFRVTFYHTSGPGEIEP